MEGDRDFGRFTEPANDADPDPTDREVLGRADSEDDDDAPEEGEAQDVELPHARPESRQPRRGPLNFWRSNKSAIITGLIVAAVAGLFPPVGNWLLGAGDAVRDVARRVASWNAGRVDDLQERVEARPYWQGKPAFLEGSLHYLREHGSSGTAVVDGLDARIYVADDVAKRAIDLDGDPIFIIGRIESTESLPGDSLSFGSQEISLTGRDKESPLILGVGGPNSFGIPDREGQVAMVRGIVVAYGRARSKDNPVGLATAYVVAFDSVGIDKTDPRVRSHSTDARGEIAKADFRRAVGQPGRAARGRRRWLPVSVSLIWGRTFAPRA